MTMVETRSEFLSSEWQQSTLNVGGVLSAIFRRRFPRDTAKRVESALDCDRTTAVNFTKGHASERTITKALRAGDWPVIMELGEAITGRSYAAFLQSITEEHARAAAAAAARQDHVRRLEARAAELVGLRAGPADGSSRPGADDLGAGEDRP